MNIPPSPSSVRIIAPASCAGPPASATTGCALLCRITSSPPGRTCRASAISLHIVPLGRNTAASCPSSCATRSSSKRVVGSAPRCSSPTSAAAIAARIPLLGRVCVSLYRFTGGKPKGSVVHACAHKCLIQRANM